MLLDLRLWGPACPRQAVGRDGPIDTQTPHKGVVEPTPPPPHTHALRGRAPHRYKATCLEETFHICQ